MGDFQGSASEQGRIFEDIARFVCKDNGFTVGPKPLVVDELGIEIDAVLTTENGTVIWAEFKGSWRGERPGMRRTDTAKKALCDALLTWADDEEYPPFLIVTSHPPEPGGRSDKMVNVALAVGAVLGVFSVHDPSDVAALSKIAKTL